MRAVGLTPRSTSQAADRFVSMVGSDARGDGPRRQHQREPPARRAERAWSPPRRQLRRAERERRPGALRGHDAGPPRPHRDGELDPRAVRAARFASVPSFLGWLARDTSAGAAVWRPGHVITHWVTFRLAAWRRRG